MRENVVVFMRSKYAWLVVVVLVFFAVIHYVDRSLFSPLLSTKMDELRLNDEQVGLISTATLIVTTIGFNMLDYLKQVHDAIYEDRVNVFAYHWWSFLHGYEWGHEYRPFFALIDVDIDKTYKRTLTKTAEIYRKISRQNGFLHSLYKTYHELPKQNVFKDWIEGL